jgi:hypothetical protein
MMMQHSAGKRLYFGESHSLPPAFFPGGIGGINAGAYGENLQHGMTSVTKVLTEPQPKARA